MKQILKLALDFSKSTKGTHVLKNEENGMTVYVPKKFFADAGVTPKDGDTFDMVISLQPKGGK